jgi:hypothetical protein
MTIFKILGTLSHTVASMLLLVFVLLCSPAEAQSQTSNQPSRDQSATPFQLK